MPAHFKATVFFLNNTSKTSPIGGLLRVRRTDKADWLGSVRMKL